MAKRFRLGYVAEPYSPDHERAQGCLAIPYITSAGVVNIRFRNTDPAAAWRYWQPKGSGNWLYNVSALLSSPTAVVLCEGELDTIVCHAYAGIPAVGLAGVNAWREEYGMVFESAGTVLIAADGGRAGTEMVDTIMDKLPNAKPAQLPGEQDCNEFYLEYGPDALAEYLMGKL